MATGSKLAPDLSNWNPEDPDYWDPKIAWQLIRESHPAAMTKAKHRGWSWWVQYVWNTAAQAAERLVPPSPDSRPTQPPPEIAAATAAASGPGRAAPDAGSGGV